MEIENNKTYLIVGGGTICTVSGTEIKEYNCGTLQACRNIIDVDTDTEIGISEVPENFFKLFTKVSGYLPEGFNLEVVKASKFQLVENDGVMYLETPETTVDFQYRVTETTDLWLQLCNYFGEKSVNDKKGNFYLTEDVQIVYRTDTLWDYVIETQFDVIKVSPDHVEAYNHLFGNIYTEPEAIFRAEDYIKSLT